MKLYLLKKMKVMLIKTESFFVYFRYEQNHVDCALRDGAVCDTHFGYSTYDILLSSSQTETAPHREINREQLLTTNALGFPSHPEPRKQSGHK